MSNPPGLPPDPHAPPTAPMYPAPPSVPEPPAYQAPSQPGGYQPPPAYQEPPSGYSVPPQYAAVPAGAYGNDPLVLPLGAPFSAWFAKVQEVAKRSWKSALIITAVGIAAPRAVVTLVSSIGGWGTGFRFDTLGNLGAVIGSLFLGLLVTVLFSVAGCFVAAAGWAAGTWALVQEAQTGQPANLGAAFRYGLKRAMALFPWTVLAGAAFTIGWACFIPGVYLAFGFSLFGFVAIFERGTNPVSRSFSLTHNSATIGPTLGKVGILFGVYLVYTFIVGLIFGAIAIAVGLGFGYRGGFGFNVGFGLFSAIGSLLSAPALAVLLIGLLPTYAELRAREAPLTTSQLQQELGG